MAFWIMVHYLYKGEQSYDAAESNGYCTIWFTYKTFKIHNN